MPPAPATDRRLVRIARGFLDPTTRGRYVAAAGYRVRATVGRTPRCAICELPGVRVVTVRQDTAATRTGAPGRTLHMRVCGACGFVGNPENTFDYRAFENVEDLCTAGRIGTPERPGREFHMAQMAVEVLGRGQLEVLIFGAGRSYDNLHVAALPQVRQVAIADIMRLRDDAEFIDANLPAPRQFGVVIASEVIEHFLDPRADLANLFAFVDPDGLLVCSTNLHDGGNLARQAYLFYRGHTSYWSAGSIRQVAADNGFIVDIRVPLVATGHGGPRKRYLLLTRSAQVKDAIEAYFQTHEYAPSESPTAHQDRAGAVTRAG